MYAYLFTSMETELPLILYMCLVIPLNEQPIGMYKACLDIVNA